MKYSYFLLLLLLVGRWVPTRAQAPAQNADTYVRSYNEAFQYGVNLGYYPDYSNKGTSAWRDEDLASIAQKTGSHSVRPTLPNYFVENYGYDIRASTFAAYVNTYGMKEITCFVEGPSPAHRETTTYPGCTEQSKLFANLYEPIWNSDGSVNVNNYYAYYLYQLQLTYGDKIRFWEVVNEPDFATSQADINAWTTRAPKPNELSNMYAPIYSYVRMLRISYEVLHKYRPDAYITTGGVGYSQFVDALLRYTDNPDGGAVTAQYPATAGAYLDALSFHSYPSYALHYWDNSIGGFRYTRTSDYAAKQMLNDRQAMADVLAKYSYNGTTHPAKLLLMTETNIARRTSDDRTGTDEMQRNFGIKALVLAQKNDIRQLYLFSLGETVDAPAPTVSVSGADEINLMGLYENLRRVTPGAEQATQEGQAFATTSKLLYGYQYDQARTGELALPASVNGAAFNKNGNYVYVLWAVAEADNQEAASATYSFPATWNLSNVQRSDWDYATTGTKTPVAAQNVALTTAPAFFTADTGPPASACAGLGTLTREQWDNVSGSTVADIPLSTPPTSSATITQFEASTTGTFHYGARLRGYVCPPASGAYSFWLTGDDAAELYLSTDADLAHKVRLLSGTDYTSGPRDYDRYPSQQSAPVTLQAGQRYYIEALHKNEWGPGYVSVAWLTPGATARQEPIPGANLMPFDPNAVLNPPTTSSAAKARITVTFATAPAAGTTARLAPTLYNKTRVLQFEEDDSPASIYTDAFALLKGGISRNGVTYPGLRYTDGCGHNRPYTAAVAVNGHNPYDNSVWMDAGPNHSAGKLLWSQAQELLNNGWDVENHSDLHTAPNPAQQIADLDGLIADRLKGYKPSVHIVPVNYPGYPTAAFNAGYLAVSSTSQSDNLPFYNQYTADRVPLSTLPLPSTQFVYQRYLADLDQSGGETTQALLNRLKVLSDSLLAPGSNPSEVYVQRVFTHVIDFGVLHDWFTYTYNKSSAQDQLWVTTLREFSEYRRVSSEVVKTQQLSGNTLTVDLDYAALSPNTRFQNLSLLLDSPGSIASISVSGVDSSSYNLATGLVNIFRNSASVPAGSGTGSGCAGLGTLTREQWDNVSGSTVADIPLSTPPTSSATITQFEASTTGTFHYGARLRGYVCPPASGAYSFWLTGDDAAELYLSTDADLAHKVRLLSGTDYTSGPRDYDRYPSQQSAPVTLQAGQRYYIEALHKNEWGPGYVSVAWLTPGATARQEPIPGANLMPFQPTTANRSLLSAVPPASAGSLAGRTALSIFPNPFSQRATVEFGVAQSGPVTLALYNLQGQLVRQLFAGQQAAGLTHSFSLDASGLSTGLYIVHLMTANEVITQKLICTGDR